MFLNYKGKTSRRVESLREICNDKWRDFSVEVHWDWRGDSLNIFFFMWETRFIDNLLHLN